MKNLKVTAQQLYNAYYLALNAACVRIAIGEPHHAHFEKLAKLKWQILEKHYIAEHGADYSIAHMNLSYVPNLKLVTIL